MTILIVDSAEWGDDHAHLDYPKDVGCWFVDGIDSSDREFAVWKIQRDAQAPVEMPAAVYLTGSSASVYDGHEWIDRMSDAVRDWHQRRIPVLGVCFGHQIIAEALGGKVEKNPLGWEVGVHEVELAEEAASDPLFSHLPRRFPVMQSHQDVVTELPEGARPMAGNALTPYQAFALGDHIRTVQFHPEYTPEHIRFLLTPRRKKLADAGVNVDDMFQGIRETPESRTLLRRFLEHFVTPAP